jgi:thiol-disulfide isomerase/thioredoxin
MKTKFLVVGFFAVAAACASLAQTSAPARAASIKPGDVAPKLQVAEWVKGTPINEFEKGKVYLVEYWATWCGPCIGNIPHLNQLQKKYGKDGLVIIGMTNPDVDADATGTARKENNTLQMVRDFVAKQGDRMDYHVAYDMPNRETYKSMMGTIGGIPHAFLFGRDGRLLVNYHPYYLDAAIEKALAGTWNYERDYAELRRSSKLYGDILGAKTYPEFVELFGTLERDFPAMAHRMLNFKFSRALKAGQMDAALRAADEMIAYVTETGDAKELASTTLATTRDLLTMMRSSLSGFMAENQSEALLSKLQQMADAAVKHGPADEYRSLAAQAELAYRSGDFPRAIELQKQVMAVVPSFTKDVEQKRAEEYDRALAEQKRREEFQRRAAAAKAS